MRTGIKSMITKPDLIATYLSILEPDTLLLFTQVFDHPARCPDLLLFCVLTMVKHDRLFGTIPEYKTIGATAYAELHDQLDKVITKVVNTPERADYFEEKYGEDLRSEECRLSKVITRHSKILNRMSLKLNARMWNEEITHQVIAFRETSDWDQDELNRIYMNIRRACNVWLIPVFGSAGSRQDQLRNRLFKLMSGHINGAKRLNIRALADRSNLPERNMGDEDLVGDEDDPENKENVSPKMTGRDDRQNFELDEDIESDLDEENDEIQYFGGARGLGSDDGEEGYEERVRWL
jgi:hypothetical protein